MKKNLISAVAAGLALALAITSFGCESGSNDPVGIQASQAYTDNLKFTYQVLPTEYTYNGEGRESSALLDGITVNNDGRVKTFNNYSTNSYVRGWTKNSYINGVNAFNRKTGAILPEIKKDNYFVAPTLGNACATKSQKVVLDAKAQTITYTEDTAYYQVVGLRLHSNNNDVQARVNADGNDSYVYITLPFSIIDDDAIGTTGHYQAGGETSWTGTETVGYINKYQGASVRHLTDLEALNYAESQAGTNTINFVVGDGSTKAYSLKELIDAYKRGARYMIQCNDYRFYYKTLTGDLNDRDDSGNRNFVKKVAGATNASGTDKGKGSYKLSGDYQNGTVTVVAWGNETYRDDGYYYKDNVLQINKADVDHPAPTPYNATPAHQGDKLYSAYRTLTISGGVLSSPRFYDGYTTVYSGRVDMNGFFFDSSCPTYDRAKTFASTSTESRTDKSKEGFQFTIVENAK